MTAGASATSSSASQSSTSVAAATGTAPTDTGHGGEEPPTEASVWAAVWSSALEQPAKCARAPTATTFAQCACPEPKAGAPATPGGQPGAAPAAAKACIFEETDEKWKKEEHLSIAALQAVLLAANRLDSSKGAIADGGIGKLTVAAVKELEQCPTLKSAVRELTPLTTEYAKDQRIPKEAADEALKLLVLLKKDPSCVPVKAPAAVTATSSRPNDSCTRHPQPPGCKSKP
jgi:hypothetical protein